MTTIMFPVPTTSMRTSSKFADMYMSQFFWSIALALLLVAFVTGGGWSGRRFLRFFHWNTSIRCMFLSGAMLLISILAW